ncbi:class I SAM-dependent methyltransferase [Corallococcus praedator]|uniref:Class I SAM-dependent methyltransferase n=1 Tax=Corallococcus praedator TaxID=2316724 RepID=A0ABX9QCM9_9BACT|nr:MULTISPECIES: class I SAM-dependent methyltransferase [Corallococcus]RKH05874.1 class I SAM-dependent methyltransferase [Corallococcus sp. CA047B]RKH22533.1 class I SAM-dependent methyltransferase [Corallococcus sp. CA031C]RKH98362.1 class I SAM-dependent methyltransferase [Corallococcus praedator]
MPNLLDLPRQALMDLRSRISHLPLISQLNRRRAPDSLMLSSPSPQDSVLADTQRVETWRRAVERYVRPNHVVVDVKAGTGLRTFLAAHQHPRRLYAVDDSRMLDTAQWVARRNGLERIDFVREPTGHFQPPEKVDVLLHDLLGDALFDAGLVPRMLDLRSRLLKRGGRILPNRFEVFVEPVQLRDEACVPFIWTQQLPNVDFRCLQSLREAMSPSYFTRLVRSYEVDHLLCEPEAAFSFDLETMRADGLPSRVHIRRPVEEDGRVDGFCLFYKVAFDSELDFTVSPLRERNATAMTLLRVEPREFSRYETLDFQLQLPDPADPRTWRWQFN